jgi:hypothetical protein
MCGTVEGNEFFIAPEKKQTAHGIIETLPDLPIFSENI